MFPKYDRNSLTGQFKTPLSKPVRVHITLFFFEVRVYIYYIFSNSQEDLGDWLF